MSGSEPQITDNPVVAAAVFIITVIGFIIGIYQIKKDILKEVKLGQIDEKLAMLYAYRVEVPRWKVVPSRERELLAKRIVSDITTIGRLMQWSTETQKHDVLGTIKELSKEIEQIWSIKESNAMIHAFNSTIAISQRRWHHCKGYLYDRIS